MRSNSAYYDRGFYSYLKKFAGDISPKLRESTSLYTRVMNQKIMQSKYELPMRKSQRAQVSQNLKFSQTLPSTIKQLDACLHVDERSKTKPKIALTNKIILDILSNSQEIVRNPRLVEQIKKLKKQQHLAKYDIINFANKNQKVKYIYNDYHTIGSKGGYSRGALGSFYTR